MNFGKYIDALLPSFGKSRMLANVADLREELVQITIPPLRAMVDTLSTRKFKAEWVRDIDEMFRSHCPIKYRGLFFVGALEILERMADNLDLIEGLIQEYYADTILRDAMTAMRLNILQYLESMHFVTQYTRRLCNMALTVEMDAVRNEGPSWNQGEMDWLTNRRDDYFSCLGIVSGTRVQLDEIFRKIPEVMITKENFSRIKGTIGETRLDPFGFGLISAGNLNPIYHVQMAIAEWQAKRVNAAKAEKQALEMKLLMLKETDRDNKAKGIVDPNMQRKLNYVQGQVDDLNYWLIKKEEEYGTA